MPDTSETKPQQLILEAINRIIQENSIAALITLIEAPRSVGAKMLVDEAGAITGELGDDANLSQAVTDFASRFLSSRAESRTYKVAEFAPELTAWKDARLLFERIEPEPRLVICGAGHVGAALARLASLVGYRTILIDDRASFVTRERFPDEKIELVAANNWTDAVRASIGKGRGVFVAVVTRGHNEDEECMKAVVAASPDYIGLIGSRRRTNIVLERLRKEGAPEEVLSRVRAPIGLDIGAVSPEEVALAILAEVVSERRGGTAAPLSAWRRKSKDEKGT